VTLWPWLAAVPWFAGPLLTLWRARGAPSLAGQSSQPPPDAPLVTVIVPARNEARNIERCVRSVLATSWPALEIIVVDDRSTDRTADIATHIAAGDSRLRLLLGEPLPSGWFGKQWACAQGAAAAQGAYLCFTDADTTHAPDLLPRSLDAMRARQLDFLTVAGRQLLGTFWERVVQPIVFTILLGRYGGARQVNRSRRVEDKIANGQFLIVSRQAYAASGGHAAVREKVAEDVALAQRFFSLGLRTQLVIGLDQLSTRMYTSLREIVAGWQKNVYVAGLDVVPPHPLMRALVPLLLIGPPLLLLAPVLALVAGWFGLAAPSIALLGLLSALPLLAFWGVIYVVPLRLSPLYAFTFPLGAALVLYIVLGAIARGRRVEWKGRVYETS